MTPLPTPPVLVITDRTQAARPLPDIAETLFAGDIRWLSLRDKDLPYLARLALARELVARAKPYGAVVTVHGDIELAHAAGAAGVHLGAHGNPAAARARLGPRALIGVSTHDLASAQVAALAGADYVTLSPIFLTLSKPGYGPALGLEQLTNATRIVGIPVVALGGINEANLTDCQKAGAAGVAIMGHSMRNPDLMRVFWNFHAKKLGNLL